MKVSLLVFQICRMQHRCFTMPKILSFHFLCFIRNWLLFLFSGQMCVRRFVLPHIFVLAWVWPQNKSVYFCVWQYSVCCPTQIFCMAVSKKNYTQYCIPVRVSCDAWLEQTGQRREEEEVWHNRGNVRRADSVLEERRQVQLGTCQENSL